MAAYGADWITGNACPLHADARDEIERTGEKLKKPGHSQSDFVAELSFGFWVGLLGPRYDATLWRRALFRAFLAGGGRRRTIVHGRFNALRRFRNRIAHHEPIFHLDLETFHSETIEAIGWMSRYERMGRASQPIRRCDARSHQVTLANF